MRCCEDLEARFGAGEEEESVSAAYEQSEEGKRGRYLFGEEGSQGVSCQRGHQEQVKRKEGRTRLAYDARRAEAAQ